MPPCGVAVEVGADTYAVLQCADRLYRLSAGGFDVTVAPALVRRGRLPAPASGTGNPDPRARWADVALLPDNRVMLRRSVWIDLGGIAKGYAVDLAMAALHLPTTASGQVNAGAICGSQGLTSKLCPAGARASREYAPRD